MDTESTTDRTSFVDRWVQAMCLAPSARADDVAVAMGIDITEAKLIGGQLTCPPPPGTESFEFIIGLDTDEVAFAEFTLSENLVLADFTERFGEGREAPPSPHEPGPTIILDEIWPTDAPRACVILIRLAGGSPRSEQVRAVTLYLRSRPENEPSE